MADMKAIATLAYDLYHGKVAKDFTNGKDPEKQLREALIEANGGSSKITARSLRDHGRELFAMIEVAVEPILREGFEGDEFFNDFVEYVNTAEGDQNLFTAEDNTTFIVSDMSKGIQTPRRQRIGEKTEVSVPTSVKGIRIYEESTRLLAGRSDWNTFVQKLMKAVKDNRYEMIYTAFSGLSASTPGLDTTYVVSGTYKEEKLLELVAHVEAATGMTARIIGTKPALRKVTSAVMADAAKDSYYNVGHFGRVAGVDMVAVVNHHKVGSTEFIIPDNKLYVVAANDKFIKFVTTGESYIGTKDMTENADMSQEYVYLEDTGCAVMMGEKMGIYTISG